MKATLQGLGRSLDAALSPHRPEAGTAAPPPDRPASGESGT